MLTEKQLQEIREHLQDSTNPVFFYDNDVDGFCSYVLLRRYIGRGKGVAVKSHPEVDRLYARRAQELGADKVFVLDRPHLGEEFVSELSDVGLPIIWIDHHDVDDKVYDKKKVFKYNPTQNKESSSEPTTYLAYSVGKREEDIWIAMIGCIADNYLPEFKDKFQERFPEYWGKNLNEAFDVFYKTSIGRIAKAISFGLKDSITHVVALQNFVISCQSPSDIELALESNKPFARKYRDIYSKYSDLIEKSKNLVVGNVLFFNYGGNLSISSDLSNEIMYKNPGKIILVAFSSGPITNISMRGKDVRDFLEKVIKNLDGANGGGHKDAVGARVQTKDLEYIKQEVFKWAN
jgi:single-stranded DNA-specific DHH superfamily exonuclease